MGKATPPPFCRIRHEAGQNTTMPRICRNIVARGDSMSSARAPERCCSSVTSLTSSAVRRRLPLPPPAQHVAEQVRKATSAKKSGSTCHCHVRAATAGHARWRRLRRSAHRGRRVGRERRAGNRHGGGRRGRRGDRHVRPDRPTATRGRRAKRKRGPGHLQRALRGYIRGAAALTGGALGEG